MSIINYEFVRMFLITDLTHYQLSAGNSLHLNNLLNTSGVFSREILLARLVQLLVNLIIL